MSTSGNPAPGPKMHSPMASPNQVPFGNQSSNRLVYVSSTKPSYHEDDLAPIGRSRRNSESNASTTAPMAPAAPSAGAPGSAAHQAGLVPLPLLPVQRTNSGFQQKYDQVNGNDHLRPIDPSTSHDAAMPNNMNITVGQNRRAFHIETTTLIAKSPYWKKLLAEHAGRTGQYGLTPEQTQFDDLDEFGMALFVFWLRHHGHLAGPHDFHSLAHYLSLYVLARKFEIEGLENQVMDLVRHYYSDQGMTAPAYRLEYIYTYTHGPNLMRLFLVNTAAFRALEEAPGAGVLAQSSPLHPTFYTPGSYLSESMRATMHKLPEIATDFVEVLIKLHRDGEHDARHGSDCDWHVHEVTPKCPRSRSEPWQSDGAGDAKDEPKTHVDESEGETKSDTKQPAEESKPDLDKEEADPKAKDEKPNEDPEQKDDKTKDNEIKTDPKPQDDKCNGDGPKEPKPEVEKHDKDSKPMGDEPKDEKSSEPKDKDHELKNDKPKDNKPEDKKPKDVNMNDEKLKDDKPKDVEPNDDRPKDQQPREDKPKEDKPKEDNPKEGEPEGDKPKEDKPKEDKPKEEKPKGDKPKGEKPKGDKPKEDKPKDDKPKDNKPKDEKPKDEDQKEAKSKDGKPKDDKSLEARPKDTPKKDAPKSIPLQKQDDKPKDHPKPAQPKQPDLSPAPPRKDDHPRPAAKPSERLPAAPPKHVDPPKTAPVYQNALKKDPPKKDNQQRPHEPDKARHWWNDIEDWWKDGAVDERPKPTSGNQLDEPSNPCVRIYEVKSRNFPKPNDYLRLLDTPKVISGTRTIK